MNVIKMMNNRIDLSYCVIDMPKHVETSDILSACILGTEIRNLCFVEGVRNNEFQLPTLPRCPSNYGMTESPISSDITYVVDNDNQDQRLYEMAKLRVYVLRDVSIPYDEHVATWVVTSDGYIRNCEDYGIIGYIDSMEIVE